MEKDKGTILVIDDQPTNLKVLLSFLKTHGYQVRIDISGERALRSLNKVRPDLILLDVMMPDMDGFETCRQIKANPGIADIPVIFMTALDSIEDKITAFEVGGVDYITKPFQQVEVLARANTHITLQKQKILLQKLALIDDLTGLNNRRNLSAILKRERKLAKRHNYELACLMFDLDHFKQINDTYGHEFGDVILQKFADIILQNSRSSDYGFRYGGEEFVILLPQTDGAKALTVGEKIRKIMAETTIHEQLTNTPVTVCVSVGVSTLLHNEPGNNCSLISRADKALYTAKKNGRNQVVLNDA